MNKDLIIREVVISDFKQWVILWHDYNCFYGRDFIDKEVTRSTWNRFLDASIPVDVLVAELNGVIVGIAHYVFHYTTLRITPVCYLNDLFVSDVARGLGIAGKLIDVVYQKAQESGSNKVYWQTREDNIAARKLYDKVADLTGFVVYAKQF